VAAQRTLITGASGFVGGWLARECADAGQQVLGISRRGVSPAGDGVAVDLLDAEAVGAAVADFRPDVVHHLAALASTGRSWEDPIRCVGENQAMTWNLFDAVRQHAPAATVVVAASGEGYGSPQRLPVDEEHRLAPGTPYAVAKTVTDLIAGLNADAHGITVIRARAFNHAGPGQGDSFLIGSLCSQAAAQSGSDVVELRTGASDVRRDWCDVRDVARAYRLLAASGKPGVFNVCSGRSTSTSEVVALMAEALAPVEVRHEVDPSLVRPHETMDIFGDRTRIEALTGWRPEIPLARTVSDALAAALAA